MPVAGPAAAAVGILGAVASGIVQKQAADKAAKAQLQMLHRQEDILRKYLDPNALNRLAIQFDKERAESRLELQKEIDPQIAELREFSKNKLLELAKRPEESLQSTQVARQLFEENIKPDERMQRLKETILDRAQEDFDAGAALPPEFQAELVRTGLQAGGRAGVGVGERSVGGVTSRLLGGAGIALKQQRAQEGANLAQTADALARSRQSLLANIFPSVAAKEAAETGRAVGGLQLAESMIPESGLSGLQGVNLEIARRKQQMDLLANRGNVRAGHATAVGQITSSAIGQATGALSGALSGGIGGLGGGGGGGTPTTAATTGALAGQLGGTNYAGLQQNILG